MTRDSKTDAPRPSLRIRRATLADAEGAARLHYLSHTISFRAFAPVEWVESRDLAAYRRTWVDRLSAADASTADWVAVDADEIVGIAGAVGLPQDGSRGGVRCAVLRNTHVAPDRIGSGIGAELWKVRDCFLREQRFALATMEIIAANSRTRRFVEGRGCRLVRIAPRGAEGVPIAIYELDLDPPENGSTK